ncbi:hypothetical protein SAMN02799631_04137 [Methylobacterium sp. 174MFSha1.1]|uniref:helix-turn-helix transcriptional regulator n=1 Tax=Methylobacterium sp. 174MFSha1.1 TaxID=1502749 RepID=UPI0008E22EAE|nr:hypothetical protein [Methylobacterium sp. 174MFSha1.1]SFV04616.1 hypothetical protein SAMN02799631_04137 [Methylobacterium sp. 174MFSha1.1]
MKIYEFSIIASGPDPHADDFETRFYDSGCDDALVAFQKGHIILDFAREAASIEEALSTAVEAVQRAGARVDRVEPDPLVTLSEIAARAGLSRAAVTHYAKGERGSGFPAPVACVTTKSPLWEWSQVAEWLAARGVLSGDVSQQAASISRMNAALTARQAVGRAESRDRERHPA